MALPYSLRSACKSLYMEKWINLLSILTVGSSLLIVTLTFFALLNLEAIANRLPERFSMVVYLKRSLTQEETAKVVDTLKNRSDVAALKFISSDEAMKDLTATLKDSAGILEGLDENPLSPSVELKLKRDFIESSSVKQIADNIRTVPGVDDVSYGEKIAEAIHRLKRSLENLSVIILITIAIGVVFVTYSTVKILFYRRKDEIDILRLLGATAGFIRTPFLIEGGIIGMSGGLLGLLFALLFYFGLTYRLSIVIPMLKTLVFPPEILISLPLIGVVLGIIGSAIAIGRLKL